MLIVFCDERPRKKVAPLGGGIELCGSSSCVGGLSSLLNTEGILTLPMFLLSGGSLIQMWSASFAWQHRVLLSVYYCEIFKFCFWVFCGDVLVSDGTVWFLWSETLPGTCWFHLCIQLYSCWLGIYSGRLYQFSVHLELDLLDAWVKFDGALTFKEKSHCILLGCVCTVHWGLWCMAWQL